MSYGLWKEEGTETYYWTGRKWMSNIYRAKHYPLLDTAKRSLTRVKRGKNKASKMGVGIFYKEVSYKQQELF